MKYIFKNNKYLSIIKDQKAQALVEFMLVFPVFIILVFGIIEFSFLSLVHQNVNFASFSGVRAETVGKSGRLSAVMRMYTFYPHSIAALPPSLAFKCLMKDLYEQYKGDFKQWLEDLLREYIDSSCFFEIIELLEEMFTGGEFSTASMALEGFNLLISKFFQGTDTVFNAGEGAMANSVNREMDEAFYELPPFIRKIIYGFLLTEVEITEDDTTYPSAPTVKTNITYYYHLKFPVIRNLFSFALKSLHEKGADPFHSTGDKWYRANLLSEESGSIFIPISHSCVMGNEQKMAK